MGYYTMNCNILLQNIEFFPENIVFYHKKGYCMYKLQQCVSFYHKVHVVFHNNYSTTKCSILQ